MAHKTLIEWVHNFSTDSYATDQTIYNSSYPDYTFYPKKIEKEIDDAFSKLWANRECPIIKDGSNLPKTNAYEDNNGLTFECFIPFAKKKDVSITLDPVTNGIKLEVEAHQDKEDREYFLNEVSRTSFKRSFAVDKRFDVKKASANFENGILKLEIPYAEDAEKIKLSL